MIGPMYEFSYVAGTLTIGGFWVGLWLIVGAAVKAYEWHRFDTGPLDALREQGDFGHMVIAAIILAVVVILGIVFWPGRVAAMAVTAIRSKRRGNPASS